MIKPDRIRFDDAVILSSDPKFKDRELQKFSKNVEWCFGIGVMLTPAILCQDIEEVPGAIDKIREWTKEGLVYPELHGWDHGPYANRSSEEIVEHLEKALEWFQHHDLPAPYRWVTPHGANSVTMQEAASKFDLIIETTEYPVIDQKQLDKELRDTYDLNIMKGRVLMVHWWYRGLSVYRIARIIEHQSIRGAIEATKSTLTPEDHKICWSGWMRV